MTQVEALERDLAAVVYLVHDAELVAGCCACGWRPARRPKTMAQMGRVLQKHADLEVAGWVDRVRNLIGVDDG